MKTKFFKSILCITLFTLTLMGCNNSSTNNTNSITNESSLEKQYDFKDVEEIANSNLTVEEQYAAATQLIDMEEYLTKEYDNIIPITPLEALQKKANGETFVIYHGRSECRYCKYVYPGTAEVAPKDLPIYYVNTDYFRFLYPEDEQSELFLYVKNLHESYKSEFDFSGVPNIKYVKNKEIALSVSNPLSSAFFDESATKESKEENLYVMKSTLSYYLDYMYKDMNGDSNTNITQGVTITK